jgi:hypothetical protein
MSTRSSSRSSKLVKLITVVAAVMALGAVEPSSKYNVPGQRRTRTAAAMKTTKVALRFPDGTTTGFFANGEDPSLDGNAGNPAPIGSTELDAQEILVTATAKQLYFRPGGGPNLYAKDYVTNGQYGHIFSTDLKTPPPPKPLNLNGKSAPLAGHTSVYYITPTRIPQGMWYKANVVNGSSGSNFYTYGNPGYDKTGGRGDWTYITWSFVQNGGATYPANVNGGGGLVRALGKRNAIFRGANVAPIVGYSYGADNKVNGRVTAFYGKTSCGPGDNKGSPIFGWLIYSYQKTGGPLVLCVRRATTVTGREGDDQHHHDHHHHQADANADAMERMAWNLSDELAADSAAAGELRANWSNRYAAAHEPLARMELLTELARIDESATLAAMKKTLSDDPDARVREQAIILVGYLRSTAQEMGPTFAALKENYTRSRDDDERRRTIDVVSSIPAEESVAFVRDVRNAAKPASEDRLAADGGLFLLASQMKVDPALLRDVTDELKQLARSNADDTARLRAITVLSAAGQDNHDFLQQLLQNEKSQTLRKLLTLAAATEPTE